MPSEESVRITQLLPLFETREKCASVPGKHYTEEGDHVTVAAAPSRKENYLLIVLSFAFVAGMAIALGIYFAWMHGVIAPAFNGAASMVALFICPPYILSIAIGPTAEADLMHVMVAGTIVFANGFLYAGVAAGVYYLFTLRFKRGR